MLSSASDLKDYFVKRTIYKRHDYSVSSIEVCGPTGCFPTEQVKSVDVRQYPDVAIDNLGIAGSIAGGLLLWWLIAFPIGLVVAVTGLIYMNRLSKKGHEVVLIMSSGANQRLGFARGDDKSSVQASLPTSLAVAHQVPAICDGVLAQGRRYFLRYGPEFYDAVQRMFVEATDEDFDPPTDDPHEVFFEALRNRRDTRSENAKDGHGIQAAYADFDIAAFALEVLERAVSDKLVK